MRPVASIVLVLLVLGWAVSLIPASSPAEPQPETGWRRTANGWERGTWLTSPPPERWWLLHPAVLAYLELLLTVLAFVGFPPRTKRRPADSRNARDVGAPSG